LDIYNLIVDHPGCYLRSIKNKLGISMGSVQYHLDRLEKTGVISPVNERYSANLLVLKHMISLVLNWHLMHLSQTQCSMIY
jgi:predicted transcriptional regulator